MQRATLARTLRRALWLVLVLMLVFVAAMAEAVALLMHGWLLASAAV